MLSGVESRAEAIAALCALWCANVAAARIGNQRFLQPEDKRF